MKNIIKKLMMYIIPVLCTGFIFAIYSPTESGKEAIRISMNEVLKETINIDYNRRHYAKFKSMNTPLNRKVKGINIMGEKGLETVEFTDSIEEYVANQLAKQYILADIYPVNPNKFNAIFKEELNKKGIICRTGIIYRHNKKPQYSDKDSITFQKAIITKPVTLDIKNTVSIQAWADCDWITILRHTNMKALGYVVFFFIASAFVLLYKRKEKVRPEESMTDIPAVTSAESIDVILKNTRIDDEKRKVYIDDKECATTNMGFSLLALLILEPDHFVTREQIIQTLWSQETKTDKSILNNRIDGHIKALREALCDFPEYQIVTEVGKGYRLLLQTELEITNRADHMEVF